METLKEKQLRVLNETVLAYNNKTRSVNASGSECFYYKEGTQGCAIGRLIANKELCKKLDIKHINEDNAKKKFGLTNYYPTDVSTIFNRLPNDVKQLTKNFLRMLQILHDDDGKRYWTDTGISDLGLQYVGTIKNEFQLN